jgi:hypothetical protein
MHIQIMCRLAAHCLHHGVLIRCRHTISWHPKPTAASRQGYHFIERRHWGSWRRQQGWRRLWRPHSLISSRNRRMRGGQGRQTWGSTYWLFCMRGSMFLKQLWLVVWSVDSGLSFVDGRAIGLDTIICWIWFVMRHGTMWFVSGFKDQALVLPWANRTNLQAPRANLGSLFSRCACWGIVMIQLSRSRKQIDALLLPRHPFLVFLPAVILLEENSMIRSKVVKAKCCVIWNKWICILNRIS